VLWAENYQRKYSPENNKPKSSADVQLIRKNPLPIVNKKGKARKPQAQLERNTKTQEP